MKSITLLMTGCWLMAGCHSGQANKNAQSLTPPQAENDSINIRQAYEQLKTQPQFLADLGLTGEKQFSWSDDFIFKIFRGDIDNDGLEDALLAFSIEGRGGGNNSDFHYAAFLQKDQQWKYAGQLDAEILAEDLFFEVEDIQQGIIKGRWRGNKDESVPAFHADYVVKSSGFHNIFTELHNTDNEAQPHLDIYDIITKDYRSLPLSGSLKEYERLLGKGKITGPGEQPECGTYWNDGGIRYLDYPYFHFELNDDNKAGLLSIRLPGSGLIIQTDHGTLAESTTAGDLRAVFTNKDYWSENEDGTESLTFMYGDSDDLLILEFDRHGKLQTIQHDIQC